MVMTGVEDSYLTSKESKEKENNEYRKGLLF